MSAVGDGNGMVEGRCPLTGATGVRLLPIGGPASLEERARAFFSLLNRERPELVDRARWEEVQADIRRYGHYEHRWEELEFGARVAWRNSVRCVGRAMWEQLEVVDARAVTTRREVADACVRHISEATNGGRVRPRVTIFPAAQGRREWRIWNYQLVRYAGHEGAGGVVTGDPAEAAFTRFCRELGWAPDGEGGAWDVLPLAVGGLDGATEWFPVPREAVLEVPMVHPDFEWFAGLGQRWYAVPFVSNMELEMGGIRYTAAPFNGWYMGTEIGSRNFGDRHRLNLAPRVAEAMGLDVRHESTLWRDRALVELNRAVLHSFKAAGVRIIDHHSVAELHVRFEEAERAAGREVSGDWSWLVPPLSGSASPLWGRSYHPVEYSPNFVPPTAAFPRCSGNR